jgi:hypothetical protein
MADEYLRKQLQPKLAKLAGLQAVSEHRDDSTLHTLDCVIVLIEVDKIAKRLVGDRQGHAIIP